MDGNLAGDSPDKQRRTEMKERLKTEVDSSVCNVSNWLFFFSCVHAEETWEQTDRDGAADRRNEAGRIWKRWRQMPAHC